MKNNANSTTTKSGITNANLVNIAINLSEIGKTAREHGVRIIVNSIDNDLDSNSNETTALYRLSFSVDILVNDKPVTIQLQPADDIFFECSDDMSKDVLRAAENISYNTLDELNIVPQLRECSPSSLSHKYCYLKASEVMSRFNSFLYEASTDGYDDEITPHHYEAKFNFYFGMWEAVPVYTEEQEAMRSRLAEKKYGVPDLFKLF